MILNIFLVNGKQCETIFNFLFISVVFVYKYFVYCNQQKNPSFLLMIISFQKDTILIVGEEGYNGKNFKLLLAV